MTTERKPHKWAEIIKAWADGKPIQYKYLDWKDSEWKDNDMPLPRFDISDLEWRVKPENLVVEECVYVSKTITEHGIKGSLEIVNGSSRHEKNIRLEFDFDTYKLVKAEVIG